MWISERRALQAEGRISIRGLMWEHISLVQEIVRKSATRVSEPQG